MERINLSDAKAHLSELIDGVERGEQIEILRRGRAVARLTPAPKAPKPKKPFDWDELRRMTEAMTPQTESAGEFIRKLRNSGY